MYVAKVIFFLLLLHYKSFHRIMSLTGEQIEPPTEKHHDLQRNKHSNPHLTPQIERFTDLLDLFYMSIRENSAAFTCTLKVTVCCVQYGPVRFTHKQRCQLANSATLLLGARGDS